MILSSLRPIPESSYQWSSARQRFACLTDADEPEALELAPASGTVDAFEPREVADAGADRDDLDLTDWADELELHAAEVPRALAMDVVSSTAARLPSNLVSGACEPGAWR